MPLHHEISGFQSPPIPSMPTAISHLPFPSSGTLRGASSAFGFPEPSNLGTLAAGHVGLRAPGYQKTYLNTPCRIRLKHLGAGPSSGAATLAIPSVPEPSRRALLRLTILALLTLTVSFSRASLLESGFIDPPRDARLRAYWWWLNGNVTKSAITRDLEQMKAKGFGGALICDAGGASQDGNAPVPHGPTFFSPQWRELYKHALREADRLGLEMSLNIQSGWNLGGPMIRADDAPKKLTWSTTQVEGPAPFERALAQPPRAPELYRDIAVLAYPLKRSTAEVGRGAPTAPQHSTAEIGRGVPTAPQHSTAEIGRGVPTAPQHSTAEVGRGVPTTPQHSTAEVGRGVPTAPQHRPIQSLAQKTLQDGFGWSAPDCSALLQDFPDTPGEEDATSSQVVDLTSKVGPDGKLHWDAPSGRWEILRIGYTLNDHARVSTCSEEWGGYALDRIG